MELLGEVVIGKGRGSGLPFFFCCCYQLLHAGQFGEVGPGWSRNTSRILLLRLRQGSTGDVGNGEVAGGS